MADAFFSCYQLYLLIGSLSMSSELGDSTVLAHQLVLGMLCLYLFSTGEQPPGEGI